MLSSKTVSKVMVALGFITTVAFSNTVLAAKYGLDKSHSSVEFKVKHLVISSVTGKFKDFDGSFEFDEKANNVSKVDFKIKADSIDTSEPKRDEHLKSKDFFEVEKFPSLEFKSEKGATVKTGKKTKIKGDLTIHGVTKPVTLDVTYNGKVKDPWGNERLAFDATTKVNRKDFGLTWNKALETGGVVVGDEINITIAGEALAQK